MGWPRLIVTLGAITSWPLAQAFLLPTTWTGGRLAPSTRIKEPRLSRYTEVSSTGESDDQLASRTRSTRKSFLADTAIALLGISLAGGALSPQHVAAKDAVEAQSGEAPLDFKAEFGKVSTGKEKVLKDLRDLVAAEDWSGVMEKARDYDLSFRKEKMGKLRKKLPEEPKAIKDEALAFTNDVTYDLIAVNKAARAGDKDRALQVCDILEGDIKSFLELERRLLVERETQLAGWRAVP